MLHQSTVIAFDLGVNEAQALHIRGGEVLHCTQGRLWVTEESGGRDIVLQAGQRYRLTHPGRAVVQSLGWDIGARCQLHPQASDQERRICRSTGSHVSA